MARDDSLVGTSTSAAFRRGGCRSRRRSRIVPDRDSMDELDLQSRDMSWIDKPGELLGPTKGGDSERSCIAGVGRAELVV